MTSDGLVSALSESSSDTNNPISCPEPAKRAAYHTATETSLISLCGPVAGLAIASLAHAEPGVMVCESAKVKLTPPPAAQASATTIFGVGSGVYDDAVHGPSGA